MSGVAVLTPPGAEDALLRGHIVNMGFGGFGVEAKNGMACETPIAFDLLTDASGEHLKGAGVIRHAREIEKPTGKAFFLGIQFTEVNKNLVTHLMNIYRARFAPPKAGAPKNKPKYSGPF